MKICFVSDLHVDFPNQPLIKWPDADVLVVAGDTANSLGAVYNFFKKNSKRWSYPHVLMVDGNHSHYSNAGRGRTVQQTLDKLTAELPDYVTFLPARGAVRVGDLYFVGRNGWYSFDLHGTLEKNQEIWRDCMNDDRWIGFSAVPQAQPWELAAHHARQVDSAVQRAVEQDPQARFVVVTHTAPDGRLVSQRPEDEATNPFYVNLHMRQVVERWAPRIAAWAHGHTHHRYMRQLDGVEFVCNPRGYPGENPRWEPVVLDVD